MDALILKIIEHGSAAALLVVMIKYLLKKLEQREAKLEQVEDERLKREQEMTDNLTAAIRNLKQRGDRSLSPPPSNPRETDHR